MARVGLQHAPIFMHVRVLHSLRYQVNERFVAGLWNNLNAGDPTKWNYEPDFANQARFNLTQFQASTRVTWQASPRNKFNIYFERQTRDYDNVGLPNSPESSFRNASLTRGSSGNAPAFRKAARGKAIRPTGKSRDTSSISEGNLRRSASRPPSTARSMRAWSPSADS